MLSNFSVCPLSLVKLELALCNVYGTAFYKVPHIASYQFSVAKFEILAVCKRLISCKLSLQLERSPILSSKGGARVPTPSVEKSSFF
jgi:hypothetical protein